MWYILGMLEIRFEVKRVRDLLIGDVWAWSGELVTVLGVTEILEDLVDTGNVRIKVRSSWGVESWTLDGNREVEVEA